jgi:Family of unknown function (DUF6348)
MWSWVRRLWRKPASGEDDSVVRIAATIAEMFRDHGVAASANGGVIAFDDHEEAVRVFFSESCLEVVVFLADGREVIEGFGGFGKEPWAVLTDAMQNFARSSFHVLLRALFAPGIPDEQVDVETWQCGGKRYVATVGALVGRGVDFEAAPNDWYTLLVHAIQERELPSPLNWIRVYYGHMRGKMMATEVLLNNDPWPELEELLRGYAWPASEEFYSVRLFLMLREA